MRIIELLSGVIIVAFMLQALLPNFIETFIFDPAVALAQPWRFVTSIFLHGGFTHLFFNLFAFFMFGGIVEQRIGQKEFLKIFFLAGIAGSMLYYVTILLGIIPPVPALGASGAIFGVMAAAAVFYPNLRVYIFFIPMLMSQAVVVWFLLEFLGTFNASSGVASGAHLGGLIIGYIYAKLLHRQEQDNWWAYERY